MDSLTELSVGEMENQHQEESFVVGPNSWAEHPLPGNFRMARNPCLEHQALEDSPPGPSLWGESLSLSAFRPQPHLPWDNRT